MAETEMVERVARASYQATPRNKPFDRLSAHQRNIRLLEARAAIEAIFKGSRFAEFGGMTVIANPDFLVHYWDGEQLRLVLDAALSPPSKD
jgi:hypothetical protein